MITNKLKINDSKTEFIVFRSPQLIKDDALAEDLDRFNVDQGCVDVDIMIEQYDQYLSDLLNKHDPKKRIYMW